VKVKDLPELDDDFAQSASEFNTVGELRSNTRKQMETMRKAGQGGQARDRAIEALLNRIDMPLPENLVEHEIEHRRESLQHDLDQAGLTLEGYAESRQLSPADIENEVADEVRRSVKARFILDQFAEQEDLTVEQDEIGQYITQLAYQSGVTPDQFARQLTSSGQLAAVVSDVLRSKAADLLAERVKVTDESGRKVTVGGQEPEGETDGEDAEPDASAEPEQAAADAAPAKGRAAKRGARASSKDDSAAKPKGRSRRGRKDEEQADEEPAAE
jgi:trigger factor